MADPPPTKRKSKIPKLVQFDPTTKDVVIGVIKLVLRRMSQQGMMPEGVEYGHLLSDADLLYRFIVTYKEHRDLAQEFTVGKSGQPVASDDEELVCGLSLAQIERLLVYTCAKKFFTRESKKASRMEDGKPLRTLPPTMPSEMKAILAFEWQLPLLDIYASLLRPEHFTALKESILSIRDAQALRAYGKVEPMQVPKARKVVGKRFQELLEADPRAIRGVSMCDERKFLKFSELTGPRVWEFFAGDPQVIIELLGGGPDLLKALGSNIPDVNMRALRELESISSSVLVPFMDAFRQAFPKEGKMLLTDEHFVQTFLRETVSSFRSLDYGDGTRDVIAEATVLKWGALRPKVAQWLQEKKGIIIPS